MDLAKQYSDEKLNYSENDTTREDLTNSTLTEEATTYSKGKTENTEESTTNTVSDSTNKALVDNPEKRGKVIYNVSSKKRSNDMFHLCLLFFILNEV